MELLSRVPTNILLEALCYFTVDFFRGKRGLTGAQLKDLVFLEVEALGRDAGFRFSPYGVYSDRLTRVVRYMLRRRTITKRLTPESIFVHYRPWPRTTRRQARLPDERACDTLRALVSRIVRRVLGLRADRRLILNYAPYRSYVGVVAMMKAVQKHLPDGTTREMSEELRLLGWDVRPGQVSFGLSHLPPQRKPPRK